ncbi:MULTISPECIES: ABC transporter ATP-binding protein [Amycolatopsis]|uniref:ATP-binding cassette, subfamily B n=1 Tax=Amycolatopsis rubida TaxID=112413 RepID=A0A1I5ZG80_9PSEU|nr:MULTISPECIES: ABC transporter ATP-binding protein [Amycolatopsis]OAP25479.1 Iron import ATP-binding/permease protein IrtA [Amycolatopsis sp. M39]SFQ55117.1 ATP-binding cassette, subfamily B [Amycolatopsis rubida]
MQTKELLKPYRSRFAAIIAFYVAGSVAGLAPLLAVAEIGRVLLSAGATDHRHAWTAVLLGALGLVVGVVLTAVAAALGHVLDGEVQLSFRRQLAAKLSRVPLSWFSGRRTGDLAKAVGEDVSTVHPFIAHAPGELVSAFVVPLVALSYLFSIDGRLTLITLVPVVLAVGLVPLMMTPPRLREQQEFDEAMGDITSAVIEFVEGIAVVKSFGGSGRAHHRFRTAADGFVTVFTRWVRGISSTAAAMQFVLSPAFVLLVVLIGGSAMVSTGSMAAVDVLPFLLLGMGLTAPVAALGHGFDELQAARRAVARIAEVLSTPSMTEPEHPGAPAGHRVEFRGVHAGYGDHRVLKGIDLVLEPGTTTALTGPSGSGKSTLVQLLPRFSDPTAGAVLLGGVDLRNLSSSELHRHISFVFQDVRVLRATIAENISLAVPHAEQDAIVRAAEQANIHRRILELPRGYESVIGEDVVLSGGEKQRVSLARALLADTPVLVLDEATSFADPQTERAVRQMLAAQAKTILMIAHRPESVAEADTVLVLEHGRIGEARHRPARQEN